MLSLHFKSKLFEALNICTLLFGLVGVLFGILGENDLGLQNEVCALFFLAVCAFVGGKVMRVIRLPELLGMLLVGMMFRYFLAYNKYISVRWSSTIRDCALTVILLKAGLGLDPLKLSNLKLAVLKLSLIPCLGETVGVTVFSRLMLGLPWIWSLMLGFIISAVSAAVLVPGMIDLDEKRFGTEKGISTLMLAAVSVDNTLALTGFFVSMSILTSQVILPSSLMKKAVEPFFGLLLGGAFGLLMWWIPCRNNATTTLMCKRALFLCIGGLNCIFLSKRFDVAGAGAFACVSYTFIASLRWREDIIPFNTLVSIIGMLWNILEIFLFGLIGIQIPLASLKQNLGMGLAILFLGILIRFTSTYMALCGNKLNCKEKTFVSFAWISKATVQAAVGSIALEYFQGKNPEERFGEEVLSISILSIVLTAPLGALVIDHLGPFLLEKENGEDNPSAPPMNSEKVAQAAHEIAQIMHNEAMISR